MARNCKAPSAYISVVYSFYCFLYTSPPKIRKMSENANMRGILPDFIMLLPVLKIENVSKKWRASAVRGAVVLSYCPF